MKDILSKSLVALILKIMGAGLAFGFNVLLARLLGAEMAGTYFLALMVMMLFGIFARMGLDNAVLRYISLYASDDRWSDVWGTYRQGILLSLSASVIATITMWFLSPWLALEIFKKPELLEPLQVMSFAVLPFALFTLHAECLKGLRKVFYSQFVQGVSLPLVSIVVLFLGVNFFGSDGYWAEWAMVIGSFVTLLMSVLLWYVLLSAKKKNKSESKFSILFESSMPLFWVALIAFFNEMVGTFMLGIYATSEDVGVFSAALRTAMLISFILIAVNSVVAPKFAAMFDKGDIEGLSKLSRNAASFMGLVSLPALIICTIFPSWVMSFFGEEYIQGGVVLSVLAVGQFFNVLTGSVGYLLMMTGHQNLMRNNALFVLCISLLLNYYLVPAYGIVGAAISTSASVILLNMISVLLVHRYLGFWSIPILKGNIK